MKKLLLLLLLIAAIPIYFFASGTVGVSSLSMILNVMTGRGIDTPPDTVIEQRFQLPEGFAINLYAGDLPNARFLHFTESGDLLLSRPHAGEVVLLKPDPASPNQAGERSILLQGLKSPSGLALADGWLYMGDCSRNRPHGLKVWGQ